MAAPTTEVVMDTTGRAEVVEAEVQVGAAATRYLRAGRGARVAVVLAHDDATRLRLIERFAACCRVVAPVLPEGAATAWPALAAAHWLRDIVEGLGLERPTVVLAPALSLLAGELSRGVDHVGDVIITAQDDEPDALASMKV
jgi:hypothetical protein